MNPGAEADEDSRVTKRFNVRVGRDFKDRVAFYFPARLNLTAEALATTSNICYEDRCRQYDSFQTIGADGNDPQDCSATTYTTGTRVGATELCRSTRELLKG